MVQTIIFSWLFGSHEYVAHLFLYCSDLIIIRNTHVETAGSLFDMRRFRKFSRGGGGVTFRPGWVQLHLSGVVITLSKWVDHGTDPYFWYIQGPEQDLTILINFSPQILGLLRLYFPLCQEKMMVGMGTVSVRLGRLL